MDLPRHFTLIILVLTLVCCSSFSEAKGNSSSSSCTYPDFCSEAARCCQFGVDDYGWIAAAVGWSLWFLTLILLCISKLMKLRPDEPKYLEA